MNAIRRLAPAVGFLFLFACSTVPEETERARGVLTGFNLVLALSVLLLVLSVGLIFAVVVIDRAARNRRRLAEGLVEETPEPEEEEVVAGITVRRAPVPAWLYGAYVLIPIFAFAYVFSNIRPPAAEETVTTPEPEQVCTDDCTIEAESIRFTKDVIQVVADSEITVTFDNTDSVIHDWTLWEGPQSGDGEELATTGTVNAGGSGTASFTSPAEGETLPFNCKIHPSMIGEVEAVAAG